MKEIDDKEKFLASLEDTEWVVKNYDKLRENYEGKFIAVFQKKVILSRDSIEELMDELEKSYSEILDFITTEFVGKKEIVVII